MKCRFLYAVLLALALAACSSENVNIDPNGGIDRGGDGGIDRGGNGGIDRGGNGGVDRGGVSHGTITGFGSVLVNGIRFDTAGAVFTIDHGHGGEDDLETGHVVTVFGDIDAAAGTGSAEEVIYDAIVTGPVALVDLAAATLEVLGQRVRVSAATRFATAIEGKSLAGLAPGAVIEVSGYPGPDETIIATRVGMADKTQYEVSGTVAELDASAMTLRISGQSVDFNGATLQQFPSGGLAPGQYVEVIGEAFDDGGQFVATRIEFHDSHVHANEGDAIELEGVVTRFASATEFDLAGQPVRTEAATVFRNGSVADLGVGLVVEIEGLVDAGGEVIAQRVIFAPEPVNMLAGRVEALDAGAWTMTLLGNPIAIDERTAFEDHSEANQRRFSFDDIATGDYLKVRGFVVGERLVAAAIEREDGSEGIAVTGAIEFMEEGGVSVLGMLFQTTAETTFQGPEGAMTPAEFFATATAGALVELQGFPIGDGLAVATVITLGD